MSETQAEKIIAQCRMLGWLIVYESYGVKIVPQGWTYPQGIWSHNLRQAFRLAWEMLP